MKKAAILMSTYNGEAFLREQLNSLLAQQDIAWDLYIRDDGSTDRTAEIIQEFSRSSDHQVFYYENGNLGPCKSFLFLLSCAVAKKYDFYFFCDQDDVWKEDKISHTLNAYSQLDDNVQANPVLLHTDLEVVSTTLQRIYPSMWHIKGSHPENNQTKNYLMENNATGCTMMMNDAAAECVNRVSGHCNCEQLVMHDWWCALVVSYYGCVGWLDEQTILYRQHGKNSIGLNKPTIKSRFNYSYLSKKMRTIHQTINQAQELKKYIDKYETETVVTDVLMNYTLLPKVPFWKKAYIMKKYHFRKTSTLNNIVYFFMVVLFLGTEK
ncbi:MAG: glycosyltransferase family 2 protein [Sporolactobacillus sp.]